MQYRSSGDLGGALPPLPAREHLIDLNSDGELLNKLIRTFNSESKLMMFVQILETSANLSGHMPHCLEARMVMQVNCFAEMFVMVVVPESKSVTLRHKCCETMRLECGRECPVAAFNTPYVTV